MSTPIPGRRVAPRRERRRERAMGVGMALVALAALLVVAGTAVKAPPEPEQQPTAAPVDHVSTACAALPSRGGTALTLAAPLADVAQGGRVTAGVVGAESPEELAARRGLLEEVEIPEARQTAGSALAVTATGGAAVGRATFQVDPSRRGAGLGVEECLPPRPAWWFTGAGAGLDHESQLVMANVDPGPAVVDVVVRGENGPVDTVGTRGITLAAGEVRVVDLLEVAPQAEELSVAVQGSRGRVVAALADSFAATPGGAPGPEWIPAQAEPARRLRLAPLPGGAGAHTLVVGNPSERDAVVTVEVSDESGSFTPTDLPELRVPPGAVMTADLGPAVRRRPAAVLVSSRAPVAATVRSLVGTDVSYAADAPVLDGPAAAVLPEQAAARVQLTASGKAASATVTAYSEEGEEVDSDLVEVAAATTRVWSPKGRAAYVVVSPRSGGLSGGVSLRADGGVAQAVLRPLPVTLTRPVVVPALS